MTRTLERLACKDQLCVHMAVVAGSSFLVDMLGRFKLQPRSAATPHCAESLSPTELGCIELFPMLAHKLPDTSSAAFTAGQRELHDCLHSHAIDYGSDDQTCQLLPLKWTSAPFCGRESCRPSCNYQVVLSHGARVCCTLPTRRSCLCLLESSTAEAGALERASVIDALDKRFEY